MTVCVEKWGEATAVGLNDESAASGQESFECALRCSKQGLLASRREHRGEISPREHGIEPNRTAGFEDLLQSADMVMGWIMCIAGEYQPICKADEPIGNWGLEVAPVILGKELGKHHGLHVH